MPFAPMSNEKPKGERKQPNRRRRKFIRKDLQLKIIFGTLFVALIVLVINFQLPIMGMRIMRTNSSILLDAHYNLMVKLLVTSFATSFLLTIPLAIWMGIVFSFQFCGPIYKIKKFFVELNSGRWDRVCRLRQKDDLKDIAAVINQFVGLARDRLRGQHAALEKVRTFLETCDKSEQVDSLLALIAEEESQYRPRLGAVEATDDQEAASTGDAEDVTHAEETESEEVASAEEAASRTQSETEAALADNEASDSSEDQSSDKDESSDEDDVKDEDDSTDTESNTEKEPVLA